MCSFKSKRTFTILSIASFAAAAFPAMLVSLSNASFITKSVAFTTFLSAIEAMSIDRFSSESNIEGLSRIYFAFVPIQTICFIALIACVTARSTWYSVPFRTDQKRAVFVGVPFFMALSFMLAISFHGQSTRLFKYGEDPISLMAYGWMPAFSFSFLTVMSIFPIIKFFKRGAI